MPFNLIYTPYDPDPVKQAELYRETIQEYQRIADRRYKILGYEIIVSVSLVVVLTLLKLLTT